MTSGSDEFQRRAEARAELDYLRSQQRTLAFKSGPGCCLYLPLIVLIAAGIFYFATRNHDLGSAACPGSASCITTTATANPTSGELPAAQSLEQTHIRDETTIDATLLNHWVPQLASFQATGDSASNDDATIAARLDQLHAQYGALLLATDDYVTKSPGYWVFVAPEPFETATAALAWCDDKGLDRDNCFARVITHDASVSELPQH